MRFVREAFFARHKHDKQFAAIGEQRRRTEMIVILMEVRWCVSVDSILGVITRHDNAAPVQLSFFEPGVRLKWSKDSITF